MVRTSTGLLATLGLAAQTVLGALQVNLDDESRSPLSSIQNTSALTLL